MKINKMLKLTLSALLLAASSSAYAQEGAVVRLKDGQTVTWQAFATAINDPSTIQSGTVPEEIQTALTNAQNGVKTANENVTAAQTAYTEAQSLAKSATESLAAAVLAYNEAQSKVDGWNAKVEAKEKERSNYNYTLNQCGTNLQQYNAKLTQLDRELDKLPQATVTKPVDWLGLIYTDAQNCMKSWTNFMEKGTDQDFKISYCLVGTGRRKTIYISFKEHTNLPAITDGEWKTITSASAWDESLYPDGTAINISVAYIFLGDKYTETENGMLQVSSIPNVDQLIASAVNDIKTLTTTYPYYTSETVYEDQEKADSLNREIATVEQQIATTNATIDETNTSLTEVNNAINTLNEQINSYTLPQEGKETSQLQDLQKAQQDAQAAKTQADTDVTNAKTALDDAKTALTEANTTLTAAQDAYNKALADVNASALDNYKQVSLTGSVTADVQINNYDGTIIGNGNVITLSNIDALFNVFGGNLSNIAVNGKITHTKGTKVNVSDVAYWMDNSKSGVFYGENINDKAEFTSIGALGYKVRNNIFGVDLTNGTGALTKFSEDTKVYNITVYQPSTTNSFKYYVNLKDGKFYSNGAEITLEPNAFIKSESADIEGMDNVIINGNECASVVITDKKPFFAPFEIQAENVTYNRTFTPGFNTVCLPFNLSKDLDSNIGGVFEYDAETAEKFWFTMIDGSIPANTPALLNTTAGFNDLILNNITIAATPKTQLTEGGSADDGLSKSHGTFKSVNAGEFSGQSQANKVYGLKVGTSTFEPAGANANFPAFRMVISSELAAQNNTLRTPRQLGIRDSKGIEITDQFTTGIESVQADASSLNVTTGVNEIIITSEADYGKVNIHSIDGKLVTVANVTAGTTTVNVNSGIYIVLGKKVMVK